MAYKKFNQGSEEWMMFTDFWKLCQEIWEPEHPDEYWFDAKKKIDAFREKHKDISLSSKLAMAILRDIEERYKMKKRG